jgi:hypothetical protein
MSLLRSAIRLHDHHGGHRLEFERTLPVNAKD